MKRVFFQSLKNKVTALVAIVSIAIGFAMSNPQIAYAECACSCIFDPGFTEVNLGSQSDNTACSNACDNAAATTIPKPEEIDVICTELGQSCTSDTNCPGGFMCSSSRCVESECTAQGLCKASGSPCVNNRCLPASTNLIDPSSPSSTTSSSSNTQSGASILANANPIKGSDIRTALGRVITIFTGLSGTLALIMFIYGGVLFLFSQGDDTQVAKAQGVFKWSTIGLLLIFTSYAILNQVFSGLEGQFGENTEGIAYANLYPLGQISPALLVGKIIQYVLGFIGVAALLVFIWGGFQYFLSMGDAKRAESGRKTVVYAVIGLVLIFISYAATSFVVNTITSPLGGAERPQSGDDIPTPPDPDADGASGLDNAGLITPTFATCGACTCVLGSPASSQETRVPLSGNFQTESECDARCVLQFKTQLKRTDCSQSGTTTTPGVDGDVGGACGQCSCSVRVPGSPTGSIEERPLESGLTIGQCSSRCQATFGTNLVRSRCQ